MSIAALIQRHRWKTLGLALVIVVAVFYPRERLGFVESSPDATHRLEYYHPHWLLGVWCYYVKDIREPMYVRLYRNSDNAYFGESPIIDVSFGESTTWVISQMGEVSLGTQFAFKNIPSKK